MYLHFHHNVKDSVSRMDPCRGSGRCPPSSGQNPGIISCGGRPRDIGPSSRPPWNFPPQRARRQITSRTPAGTASRKTEQYSFAQLTHQFFLPRPHQALLWNCFCSSEIPPFSSLFLLIPTLKERSPLCLKRPRQEKTARLLPPLHSSQLLTRMKPVPR